MNFNQQMQEKAEKHVREEMKGWFPDNQSEAGAEAAYFAGSRAALSSDLVKGLVGALENIEKSCDGNNPEHELFWRISSTALTNFKQEINENNIS